MDTSILVALIGFAGALVGAFGLIMAAIINSTGGSGRTTRNLSGSPLASRQMIALASSLLGVGLLIIAISVVAYLVKPNAPATPSVAPTTTSISPSGLSATLTTTPLAQGTNLQVPTATTDTLPPPPPHGTDIQPPPTPIPPTSMTPVPMPQASVLPTGLTGIEIPAGTTMPVGASVIVRDANFDTKEAYVWWTSAPTETLTFGPHVLGPNYSRSGWYATTVWPFQAHEACIEAQHILAGSLKSTGWKVKLQGGAVPATCP